MITDTDGVIDAYFDLAHFWGDIDYVMKLDMDEMELHHRQARRIMDATKRR